MPPKRKLAPITGQISLKTFIKSKDVNNNDLIETTQTQVSIKNTSVTNVSKVNTSEAEVNTVDQSSSTDSSSTTNPTKTATYTGILPETKSKSINKPRKVQDTWFKIWPWLYESEGALFCKTCVDSGKHNAFVSGCKVFKTSSMQRHQTLDDHNCAESAPRLATGFQRAVTKTESLEDKAMLKCITTVLWLAAENIPLAKFEIMFRLFRDINVPDLGPLRLNDRVKYESYYTGTEVLNAISSWIDNEICLKIANSPYITILADESTDLANKKRMTLNARIVDSQKSIPETVFLRDVEYEDGTGVGLATVITDELTRRDISINSLVGFGSDGASVMSGGNKGFRGILMQQQPHLVHIHCMAHRLALCTSQAADLVPAIKKYQQWLTSVFYYFSQSSSREQELHKVQQVLESPVLKYKEIHAVRWLSVYQAVDSIYRTLDPLMSYFHQREASKDPKAKGLLKQMAAVDFVYITYLLIGVLAIVSRLCLIFQEANLDVATAKVAIDNCLRDLESYKEGTQLFSTHIEHFPKDVIDENGQKTFKGHYLTTKPTNLDGVKSHFINSLLTNIRKRFPQKSLVDAFYVLGMRSIHFESEESAKTFGNEELEQILSHFGEEMEHKGTVSPPKVDKVTVRSQWELAKHTVRSMKYPVDRFVDLWQLLTIHHHKDLDQLIGLAQIAMILPLHTADCERTFSQQNKILTKSRANLSSEHLDQLIRVRLFSKSGGVVNKEKILEIWKTIKSRKLHAVKLKK